MTTTQSLALHISFPMAQSRGRRRRFRVKAGKMTTEAGARLTRKK